MEKASKIGLFYSQILDKIETSDMGTSTRQPVQIFPYAYRACQQGSLCSYFHMHRAYTHAHTHSYTVLYIKVLVAFRINEKSASKFSLVVLLLETGNPKPEARTLKHAPFRE